MSRFNFRRSKVYTTHNQNEEKIQRFYESTEWRKLSKQVKEDSDFLCEWCMKDGIINHASYTHHIVEIRSDWSKRLTRSNLVAVCAECHEGAHNRTGSGRETAKTRKQKRQEQIKKNKAGTTDGWFDN